MSTPSTQPGKVSVRASTIPVRELVKDLTKQFSKATEKFPNAERGNITYKAESDFAYFINEIMMGPSCMVYEQVNECKKFIETLKTQK